LEASAHPNPSRAPESAGTTKSRATRLRRGALSLAVLLASLAILAGWYRGVTGRFGLTGDEPHYIMIAHSLATDGDLDLRNNYAEGDSEAWFPDLDADQHVHDYRGDGRLIPVHTPGLPVLLMPAYLLLDDPTLAARGTMLLITALTLLQFYLLCREVSGSRWLPLAAWLALATSVPVLYLAGQVYPDVAAALFVLVAVRAWLRLPAKGAAAVLAMAVCVLPFLHVRFIPISLVLAVAALLRLRRAPRPPVTLFLALCLAGGAGFVAFYVSAYGSPFGNAQYAYLSPDPVNWSRFPALAMGLLWEREVGILPVAPVLVLGIIGAAAALVERDRRMLLVVALTVIYTLVVALALAAGLADWGWSLPWRFVLPITPVMALLGFHAAHQYRIIRWLAVPLLGAGLLIALLSVRWPGGFYWRNAGVLAMPALNRVQSLLPSDEFATVRSVDGAAGVTTTREEPQEITGEVCAIPGRDEAGFLSWGIRKGMLPGDMNVTLYIRAELDPSGASPGQVRTVDERTDATLFAHDVVAADLDASGSAALTFAIHSGWALLVMAPVTYSGAGTLCLEKVVYEQTALAQMDCGWVLAVLATLLLAALGLTLGLLSRRSGGQGPATA
jgi:hypothetical protein